MRNSSLTYYAELLSNLRIIWLTISLPKPTSTSTSTRLTPQSPHLLTLHHDSKTYTIRPPVPLPPASLKALETPPATGENTISYRLPTDASALPEDAGNNVPWSATHMEGLSIHCGSCRSVLVEKGMVNVWKNLPSGNWAEMMDFWHCHKPHSHSPAQCGEPGNGGKYENLTDSYTAPSGTGLVDVTYFLLDAHDCSGIKVSDSTSPLEKPPESEAETKPQLLMCEYCDVHLGIVDTDAKGTTRGWRINKWTVCTKSPETSFVAYPLEHFVSAQLLSLVNSEGARKFLLTSPGGLRLKIWLFNTDIRYTHSLPVSSPSVPGPLLSSEPVRAMKVYYQQVPEEEVVDTDALKAGSFEVLGMGNEVVAEIERRLRESAEMLPEGARTMGVWRIGMLGRFE